MGKKGGLGMNPIAFIAALVFLALCAFSAGFAFACWLLFRTKKGQVIMEEYEESD
jgi:hypothetical protein